MCALSSKIYEFVYCHLHKENMRIVLGTVQRMHFCTGNNFSTQHAVGNNYETLKPTICSELPCRIK